MIDVKGNTTTDFKLANKAAGITIRPEGYTWHHHHDGKAMLLVPIDIHEAVRHTAEALVDASLAVKEIKREWG